MASHTPPVGRGGVKVWKIGAETEPLSAFLWRSKTTPPGGERHQLMESSAALARRLLIHSTASIRDAEVEGVKRYTKVSSCPLRRGLSLGSIRRRLRG